MILGTPPPAPACYTAIMDTKAAVAIITMVSSAKDKLSRREIARLLVHVDALIAPCSNEKHRCLHEDAAVAALTIDDVGVRLSAIDALFMHGQRACLPMLRRMADEPHMHPQVRDRARMAHAAVAARSGEPGSISVALALPGALSNT